MNAFGLASTFGRKHALAGAIHSHVQSLIDLPLVEGEVDSLSVVLRDIVLLQERVRERRRQEIADASKIYSALGAAFAAEKR